MFRLTIDTDNDAFKPYPGSAIAPLLRQVADAVPNQVPSSGTVRDYNGNTVGSWTLDAAPDALQAVIEALRDLREAATSAYKAGRISGEAFVRAGNVLDGYPAKTEGRADKYPLTHNGRECRIAAKGATRDGETSGRGQVVVEFADGSDAVVYVSDLKDRSADK